MAGLYGAGGFPLAATLAPMRKSQIDTTTSLGVPAGIDRQIRRRAEQFFASQGAEPLESGMRERTDQFARTQQARYRARPR